jgi:hypothetical protein
VSVPVAGSDVTLATNNNADDEARNAYIVLTGTPGATRNIIFPDVEKLTWVLNNTDATQTLKAGAGTTVSLRSGYFALVASDGATNMSRIIQTDLLDVAGIRFPSTQVPSADANTLDDYEEGTFTPAIAFGGAAVGVTYSTQSGSYTKIGNRVFYALRLVLTSNGTSVGVVTITGLPFTQNEFYSVPVIQTENVNLDVAGGYYSVTGFLATTTVVIDEQGDNVALAALTEADVADTAVFDISGHYKI